MIMFVDDALIDKIYSLCCWQHVAPSGSHGGDKLVVENFKTYRS